MTDAEVVMHETGIDLADVPDGLRDLTVKLCRRPLSVLMAVAEEINNITDEKAKADMVMLLIERRLAMRRARQTTTAADRRARMERARRRWER